MALVLLMPFLSVLSGCLSGGEPPVEIRQHVLEYDSPEHSGLSPLDVVLKVNRFGPSPLYDSPRMVYRTGPFERRSYNYHRWMVDPAQMVTSYLIRDLRSSELFRAVLSFRSMEPARYLLTGEVEEFLELDTGEKAEARLTVQLILWDSRNDDVSGRVLLQKRYGVSGPKRSQTAEGFAASMSEAMGSLSQQVGRDIHRAVREAP
jgi:ABC-type uncharacterized transport system auxiliary subunit